jgi:hypothetical protein
MAKFQRTAIFSLLLLCAPSLWATQTPAEKANAVLTGLVQTNDPGFAVLVAQDGRILFEKGYGLADRERGVPVTPQTIFRIASITTAESTSSVLNDRTLSGDSLALIIAKAHGAGGVELVPTIAP